MAVLDQEQSNLGFRALLLLCVQTALLGEIRSSVRGITLSWSSSTIVLRAIVDGVIAQADRESMDGVATEILASIATHAVEVEIVRIDAPRDATTAALTVWVYLRKEALRRRVKFFNCFSNCAGSGQEARGRSRGSDRRRGPVST